MLRRHLLLHPAHRGLLLSRNLSAAPTEFASEAAHVASLESRAALPQGFRVGAHTFSFSPAELANKRANMTLTLLALDKPTPSFAAMFTTNAFPGAPVLVGRARVASAPALQAVVINNKISNVCAPGGVEASEALCAGAAAHLGLASPQLVFPSSTGGSGWGLPVPDMLGALPGAAAALQGASIIPAARGICTTDLYPKVRARTLPGGGRLVGIAKGAGMVEPGLATMLVYILTDVAVGREELRNSLREAVAPTFNSLSIDSDMSTSDTILALSSNAVPLGAGGLPAFSAALREVCGELAEDVVRNGEGVSHVIRVRVVGAPSGALAQRVGKAIVNSPLFKCAVAGNDPNVGRLVAAIGKCVGALPPAEAAALDMGRVRLTMGGVPIFSGGVFSLSPATEAALVAHLKAAQLWESAPLLAAGAQPRARKGAAASYAAADVSYATPVSFPPHERCVEVGVDLGVAGGAGAVVLGSDLTHEYVAENADVSSPPLPQRVAPRAPCAFSSPAREPTLTPHPPALSHSAVPVVVARGRF